VGLEDEADRLGSIRGGTAELVDAEAVDDDRAASGVSSAPIRFSSVLLPDPEAPVSATSSPGSTANEISRSAGTRPSSKDLRTPVTRTAAPVVTRAVSPRT
jgi:hypothetical protein